MTSVVPKTSRSRNKSANATKSRGFNFQSLTLRSARILVPHFPDILSARTDHSERQAIRKGIQLLGGLFFLSFVCAQAQQTQRFALLRETEASLLRQMYPKSGPNRFEGGWQPTSSQIEALETNLPHISELHNGGNPKGQGITHPETYYRQYLPVVRAGKKLIYVNAICDAKYIPDWRTHFAAVMDGGPCFWQAWYDPSNGTFAELTVNGRA